MKQRMRQVGIIILALLLAMLFGMLVTRASADGPVIWKQFCPMHYEVRQVKDGTGVTVLCVRMAEVDDAGAD
jgi:hypothetical protein